MQGNINLIPQEERYEQQKVRMLKASTIFTIFILLIVAGFSAYYFFRARRLSEDLVSLENSVSSLRADVGKMASIEINARNLDTKSKVLMDILSKRLIYSKLLTELYSSIPSAVTIEELSMGADSTLNISGLASDYNSVQSFMNQTLKNDLFSRVALNSVNLDEGSGKVRYFVVLTYKAEKLTK